MLDREAVIRALADTVALLRAECERLRRITRRTVEESGHIRSQAEDARRRRAQHHPPNQTETLPICVPSCPSGRGPAYFSPLRGGTADDAQANRGSSATERSFRDFFHAIVALMKEHQITAVYNHENPEMLDMSSMMGEFKVSSLVDNIILMNWVELGDSFRHALTVAKMRAMPTSRTTHECEIVNGQGMKVLPRPLRAVFPVVPFAGYLGLISRSPERRPPPRVPETP